MSFNCTNVQLGPEFYCRWILLDNTKDLPLLLQDSKDCGKKEWKEQRAKQSRSDVKQGKWESCKDNYFGYLSATFLFKLCITRTHCFWLSCCDAVSTKSSLAYYNIHYLACKTGYLIPHLSKISAIAVNWPSDSSMHGFNCSLLHHFTSWDWKSSLRSERVVMWDFEGRLGFWNHLLNVVVIRAVTIYQYVANVVQYNSIHFDISI